jgi:hypothetical protein
MQGATPSPQAFTEVYGAPYTSALIRHQKGRGAFTNFFKNMYTYVKPLLKTGAKAASTELLHSGSRMLSDLATSDPMQRKSDIIRKHIREGTSRSVRKAMAAMQGQGRRRRPVAKKKKKKKTRNAATAQRGTGKKGTKRNIIRRSHKKNNQSLSTRRVKRRSTKAPGRRTINFKPDIFG